MKVIFFTLSLLLFQSAHAGFFSGNDLYAEMLKTERADTVIGYVAGAADMLSEAESMCFPKNMTIRQIYEIVKKDLTENPEKRHHSASSLIFIALEKAGFLCKK